MSSGRYRLGERLRYLMAPLLLVALGFLAAYTLADWLLTRQPGAVFLDDDVLGYWLPLGAGALAYAVWVHRRTKSLALRRNGTAFYFAIGMFVIAAPAMIAHTYLVNATGTLTRVADGPALASAPNSKYYGIASLCVAKDAVSAAVDTEVSGRNSETLNIDVYYVMPLCPVLGQTSAGRTPWIGVIYSGSIDNRLSDAEREMKFRAFLADSDRKFDALDPASFTYFQQAGGSHRELASFDRALERNRQYAAGASHVVLVAKTNAFAERSAMRLYHVPLALGIGVLAWAIAILVLGLDETEFAKLKSGARPERETDKALRLSFYLVPSRDSFALPLLLDINIGVFAAMVIAGLGFVSFRTDDLLDWGANFRPAMQGLGWFRLVTSQFVHGGFIHLINNLFSLLIFGAVLQGVLGSGRLLLTYLVSGIGGSLASIAVNPETVSIGASGSIFGLCGMLLGLLLVKHPAAVAARDFILRVVPIMAGINLVMGFVIPGIDNAAHIGGFLTGACLAILMQGTGWSGAGGKPRRAGGHGTAF